MAKKKSWTKINMFCWSLSYHEHHNSELSSLELVLVFSLMGLL